MGQAAPQAQGHELAGLSGPAPAFCRDLAGLRGLAAVRDKPALAPLEEGHQQIPDRAQGRHNRLPLWRRNPVLNLHRRIGQTA